MRVGSRALLFVVLGAAAVEACASDATDASSTKPAPAPTTTTPTDGGAHDAAADADDRPVAPPPPVCSTIDYSDWSICKFSGTQTRTVVSSAPAGCYTSGLVLKQPCTFTAPTDAAGLYTAYCSDCHGNGKKGATAMRIQNAINGNSGGMSVLSDLTPAQVALIASAP